MAKPPQPLKRPASTSAADIKAFVDQRIAASRALVKARQRGELKPLTYHQDPLAGVTFTGDPINDLNAAIAGVGDAVRAETVDAPDPLVIDPAEAAKKAQFKAREQRVREVWLRTTDRSYYFSVVFDAGNQARAFLDALRVEGKLMQSGDLYIDGRALADALGIQLPEPNYPLAANLKEPKNSRAKRAKKITKG